MVIAALNVSRFLADPWVGSYPNTLTTCLCLYTIKAWRSTTHVLAWESNSEVCLRRDPIVATFMFTFPRCIAKAKKLWSEIRTVWDLADDFHLSSSLSSMRTVRLMPRNALLVLLDLDFEALSGA